MKGESYAFAKKKNQPNDRSHEKRSVLKVYAKGNLKSVIVKKDNLEGRMNPKKDKLHFFSHSTEAAHTILTHKTK